MAEGSDALSTVKVRTAAALLRTSNAGSTPHGQDAGFPDGAFILWIGYGRLTNRV